MIGFIDKRIEKLLKRALHKKRDAIFRKTLDDYITTHNPDEATIAALTKKLEDDIDRIITLADRSVIHANMLRARYVFWITAIIGTAIVVALAVYPVTTAIAPFFVPLMAAFVGWAVAVGTIPVSYIHTVKGVMDAAVVTFDKEQLDLIEHAGKQAHPANIEELQKIADDLLRKLNELSPRPSTHEPSDFYMPPVATSELGLWQARQRCEENDDLLKASPEIRPRF